MKTLIFGYGSLINDNSRKRTVPLAEVVDRQAELVGYGRKTNLQHGDYVYMNIVPRDKSVVGTIISVSETGLEALIKREEGYDLVEVTDSLARSYGQPVFAFVAPDVDIPGIPVPQSYLDTCTANMTESEKEQWIKNTEIPYGIYDDTVESVYENVA